MLMNLHLDTNTRTIGEGQRMNILFQNTEVRTSYKSLING